jgi:uncharacterized protein with PhoU and TrkA domain
MKSIEHYEEETILATELIEELCKLPPNTKVYFLAIDRGGEYVTKPEIEDVRRGYCCIGRGYTES